MEKPSIRAVYSPRESPDLPYQAQWYSGTKYHPDGYERGGWYATEREAITGAKRGLRNMKILEKLLKDNR